MPDAIEIRPVLKTEWAAAGDATARAYREFRTPGSPSWDAYLARIADVGSRAGRAVVLVAAVDAVIAGSVTLELDSRISREPTEPLASNEAHLRMLGVSPEYRGRGIAHRLVLECIHTARVQGKRVMTLETNPLMTAARHLYAGLGFVSTGPQVRPDGLTLIGYTLDIDSNATANR